MYTITPGAGLINDMCITWRILVWDMSSQIPSVTKLNYLYEIKEFIKKEKEYRMKYFVKTLDEENT